MPEYDLGGNHAQRGQYAGIRGQLRWNRHLAHLLLEMTLSFEFSYEYTRKFSCNYH